MVNGQSNDVTITEEYTEVIDIIGLDEFHKDIYHSYIVNKAGSNHEYIYCYYDDFVNEIQDLEVVVESLDGSNQKKYKKKDFKDRSAISSFSIYENSRLKYLNLSNATYPYRIIVKSKQKYKSLAYLMGYFPTGFNQLIRKSSLVLNNPKGIGIKHKVHKSDSFVISNEADGSTRYTYVPQSMYLKESNVPSKYAVLPYVMFSPSMYKLDNTTVDNSTWRTMGQYYYDLNIQTEGISRELAAELHRLTDNKESDRDKALAIHKKVVNELRYVSVQLGIGGWKSFSPKYVEERKYGDCKAMTCFLRACLDEVGVDSKMMLINSGYNDDLMDDTFVYRGFNHAILYIPSLDLWLDPTREHALPGYLGIDLSDKWSLMLDSKESKLIKSPDLSISGNYQLGTLRVNDIFSFKVNVHRIYGGIFDHSFRSKRLRKSDAEQMDYIAERWNVSPSDISNLRDTISEGVPKSITTYNLIKKDIFDKSGNRLFIPLFLDRQGKVALGGKKIRQNDYKVWFNSEDEMRVELKIPDGYKVEYLPGSKLLESAYGQYTVTTKVVGDYVIINRTLTKNKGIFSTEKYQKVYQFLVDVSAYDNEEIVLVQGQ